MSAAPPNAPRLHTLTALGLALFAPGAAISCAGTTPVEGTSATTAGAGGGSSASTTSSGDGGAGVGGGTGVGGAGGSGGGGEIPPINEGFIGGPCESNADCAYMDGFCLPEAKGFPGGMCSLDCALFCPDKEGAVSTFCAEPAALGTMSTEGLCTTRCAYGLSPSGCREGYQCQAVPRHDQPATVVYACVPGTDDPFPLSACHKELLARGIGFAPAMSPKDHPDGHPELLCDIEDPVWITPILHGVSYRPTSVDNDPSPLFVACPMALAIDRASEMLAERGGTDLVHLGTYNCRVIAGTASLSEHGLARALDIAGVRLAGGSTFTVLTDWEKDQPAPTTTAGKFLKELVKSYHEDKVFNIILTPDYNAAHADHFHCDLTPGSDLLN
ncbi:MAG: extensin family protein [Minicystis sp.]